MRIWEVQSPCFLSWAMIAQAEPLNLKQIPDDAKWLAHFNVDAMRDSTVVKRSITSVSSRQRRPRAFGKARERISMDPRSACTGSRFTVRRSARARDLIVHATVDKELLLKSGKSGPAMK